MHRVRFAGLTCLAGGLLFAGLNSVEDLGFESAPSFMFDLVGALLLLGLMGGPLGLLALRAAGSGRTGRIGSTGAAITLMGLCSYLAGVLYTGLVDPEMGLFYALGALLSGVGMLPLGIAVIIARRIPNWRRFAPFLVGLYYLLMIPIQIVFFIGPSGKPSGTLLAFWGLMWALLGYAIFTSAYAAEANSMERISSAST